MTPSGPFKFLGFGRSKDPDDRRRRGRVGVEELVCSAGDVIDLSSTGARIQMKKRWDEGETREVTLTGANVSTTISAVCVWERQEGFRRRIVGVQFIDCTPEQEVILGELARRHSVPGWGAPRGANDFNLDALEKKQRQASADAHPSILGDSSDASDDVAPSSPTNEGASRAA